MANSLFVFHLFVGIFFTIGWIFTQIQMRVFYLVSLLAWVLSWVVLNYCPLSKWEFVLRSKYDKNIEPNTEMIKYYMYKFFKIDLSEKSILLGGIIVLNALVFLTFLFPV